MSIYPIILFLIFLVNFLLAIFVFRKNPKGIINRSFGIFILCSGCWSLMLGLSLVTTNVLLAKISTIFGLFANSGFVLFSRVFHPKGKTTSKWINPLLFLIPGVIAFLILTTNFVIKDFIFHHGNIIEPIDGSYIIVFYFFHIVYAFWSFINLIKNYKYSEGIIKIQFKYLFTIIFLITFGFLATNLLLPILGIYHFIISSSIFIGISAVLFSYAILKYRLMDIQLAIKKTAAHTIAIAVILAVYTFIILFIQKVLVEQYSWNFTVTVIITVLIIALSVEPLRKLVIKSVNKIFYTEKEKEKEQVFKSSITLASITELEQAIEHIVTAYLSFLESEKIYFLVRSKKNHSYQCHYPKGCQLAIKADEPLLQYLRLDPRVLVKNEIPYLIDENDQLDRKLLKSVEGRLKKLGISLIIPLGSKEEIFALFLLGHKKKDEAYTKEEIDSLQHFQITTSPVILNAIMYKEAVERITAD